MSISGTNQATDSVPFGAVVATGDATSNGTAGTPARSDHVHKGVVAADAWTSYTPTLTQSGAVTKTVTYAKYIQLGKTVLVQAFLTCTGAGTGANNVIVGLPATAAANGAVFAQEVGTGTVFDSSANLAYKGNGILVSTTTAVFRASGTSSGVFGTTDFTAALASGDTISFSFSYEAA